MKKKKKKKTKLKKGSIKKLLIIILIIYLLSGPIKLMFKGYSIISSFKINLYGIKDKVLDNKYSKTLDKIVKSGYYDKDYLDEYFSIKYYNRDNFSKNTDNYLELGYKAKSINRIYEINDSKLYEIASKRYNKNLVEFLKYDYFKPEFYDRYQSYFNGDYSDTLIKVNIGLDKDFYSNPNEVKEFSTTMIVNKYNKLDESFVPPILMELDNCSNGGEYLTKEAKDAFDKLCKASIENGLSLGTTSAYRSYQDQENTYKNYVKTNGEEYAKKYASMPGYSEHQTGLAIDVKSTVASPFKITKEYKWMLENAYKYGFILRYPENKEEITGFNGETWHFRYVGEDIAKYIKEHDITYEEYCAIFM